MNEEENGTVALQTEQPAPPPIGLNMQMMNQGVVLSFPVNLGIDNATMVQLIRAYLQAHPEIMQELVRESIAQKQQELSIIQMVRQSKNN
jgi:hypothetical protein